jgi:putative tricarboxylic transport membrane protein
VKLKAPDLWIGLMLIALAASYYRAALAIPESLLSDEVGAAGLPTLLAAALAFSGALLALRSQGGSAIRVTFAVAPQAAGLLLVMIAYIAVLPVAGYPLALAALVAASALLAGAKPTLGLGVTVAAAGLGFWLIFAWAFHIAMPAGLLARWI